MGFFNHFVEKIQNWNIVRRASKYSVCDVDVKCSSCVYCSKKGKYCTNETIYRTLTSTEQVTSYNLTGFKRKKIRLHVAAKYCNHKYWCFSSEVRYINGKYYCFLYNRYNYSDVGWRECRFWVNDVEPLLDLQHAGFLKHE